MNVYWASQHFEDLAQIRQGQGLPTAASTPSFLIQVHQSAMNERAARGGRAEHKVRQIARRAMSRTSGTAGTDHPGAGPGEGAGLEPAWNTPPQRSP
jgi:hypothetical protein